MENSATRAHRYLVAPGELISDFEPLLWEEFAEVFTDPCVTDSNLRTTFVVAYSDENRIAWTIAGKPTEWGTTFEQGAFVSKISRIMESLRIARLRNPTALSCISPETLQEFITACMKVRSGVANSSPSLGSTRNTLLGQIEDLRQLIILDTLERTSPTTLGLTKTETTGAELLPGGPDETKPLAMSASVNALMIELMQKHGQEECLGWSVRRWALELEPGRRKKPAESTIHGTPTYRLLKGLRDQAKAAMVERQTVKDIKGDRRSTRF